MPDGQGSSPIGAGEGLDPKPRSLALIRDGTNPLYEAKRLIVLAVLRPEYANTL